jgi:hypothetical protein
MIFNSGEKVYDTMAEKSAIVVNLRNDSHERLIRSKDPTHYYYHLNYDDGTFNTYVSGEHLKKNQNLYEKTQSNSKSNSKSNPQFEFNYQFQSNPQFEPGQRFINTRTNKTGTIKYLRNDERERNIRLSNPTHYYYNVDYDDGSFETYEYGQNLKLI